MAGRTQGLSAEARARRVADAMCGTGFWRDVEGYLRSRGVTCGWSVFRAELERRAVAAGAGQVGLAHPIAEELLRELSRH